MLNIKEFVQAKIMPVSDHPEAVAARARALMMKEAHCTRRANLIKECDRLAVAHKLKFIDITPHPYRVTTGMTIAYSGGDGNVLKVSTAIRKPSDTYDKLLGRHSAAHARNDGHWIYIRKPKGIKTHTFLRLMFAV